MYFQEIAQKHDCQQALWLFGPDEEITEVGAMNIFAFFQHPDGRKELVTPSLESGLILPGVTRRSVLELAEEWNEFDISERKLTIHEVLGKIHLKSEFLFIVFYVKVDIEKYFVKSANVDFMEFLSKTIWAEFRNFSTENIVCVQHSVKITRIYSHSFFGKNFVKVTLLLKKLLKSWFDEILIWWEFFRFSHCTVWK